MAFKISLLVGAAALGVVSSASAKDLQSVGVSVSTLGNPFFISLVKGIGDEAKRINPSVHVTTAAAEYELNKQFTQIDNFIAAGVDLILLSASDPKGIAPAVKRAQAAGIVVIAVDVVAAGADATVQTDNTTAGTLACQYLADKLDHQGNVVIMNGPPVSSIIERVDGCKRVLANYPGITILSSDQDAKASREGGMNVMQGYLTKYPSVQGLFSVTDQQTLGADLAAKQMSRDGIVITSIDGAPDVIPALKGHSLIQATVAQDPYAIGQTGVSVGNDILQGKKPANAMVLMPPKLIDRDNVGTYKGW